MRLYFVLLLLTAAGSTGAQQKGYPITPVNFSAVKLTDNFWLPRIQTNHTVTIPASFERCESTGRVKNFEMAAARSGKFCTKYVFDDTDIYKTIEGASYSLSLFPDKKMESYIDSLIVKIRNAQEPDGYLYTARTIDPKNPPGWSGKERWEKERELSHELYNSGHLYEAAAAHYYATGKKTLLNIALKNADLVCSVFGPGRRSVAPGHQVVEMGLVKLYLVSGRNEYLETAKFFINARGKHQGYDPTSKDSWKNGSYWQDHKAVVDQKEAVGHAVRAGYLYAGTVDVAALTGDKKYMPAMDSIWENVVSKKLYVQGSIGAAGDGERFGDNYELPNSTAYNETCAAIANVYWNHRMFLYHGDARYIDVLERTLYNGLLSGIGLDGKSFFYSNAMEIRNNHLHRDQERKRSGWFECSCCPTNMTRLLPSIPGYIYAQKNDSIYINLFATSGTTFKIHDRPVFISQENNYPWEGDLRFTVTPKSVDDFTLMIRVPGWAGNEVVPSDLYKFYTVQANKPELKLNGRTVEYNIHKGYAVIKRSWKKGDVVQLQLPMDVRKVASDNNLKENKGKIALQRGPLIYCAEWVDNNGKASNIILPETATFSIEPKQPILNGITVLSAELPVLSISTNGQEVSTSKRKVTFIPYYAWANRGEGEMIVWFPASVREIEILAYSSNTSGNN